MSSLHSRQKVLQSIINTDILSNIQTNIPFLHEGTTIAISSSEKASKEIKKSLKPLL